MRDEKWGVWRRIVNRECVMNLKEGVPGGKGVIS
jgi:hypothetical protein